MDRRNVMSPVGPLLWSLVVFVFSAVLFCKVIEEDFRPSAQNLFYLLFIAPFLLLGVAILFSAIWQVATRSRPNPPRYSANRFQNLEIVRLSPGWFVSGATGLGIGCFVGVFLVAIPGKENSFSYLKSIWIFAFACGALSSIVTSWWNASGRCDLILDHNRKTISIPARGWRKERTIVAFAEVQEVQLKLRHNPRTDSDSSTLDLVLYKRDGNTVIIQHGRWWFGGDRLADWLRRRVSGPGRS